MMCGLAQAQAPLEGETRIASVLNIKGEDEFRRKFMSLSYTEQSELIRILTTDMPGWTAVERIPLKRGGLLSEEQRDTLTGLEFWLKETNYDATKLNHLRFVTLTKKPFEMKLRYEKGACVGSAVQAPSQRFLAWTETWVAKLWKRDPASAPVGSQPHCPNREVSVALIADPGLGDNELKEMNVARSDQMTLITQMEGVAGLSLRKRIWEEIEIFHAEISKDKSISLAQRLRVIEVAGTMTHNEFMERRRQAILLRNETNQAHARHSIGWPVKLAR